MTSRSSALSVDLSSILQAGCANSTNLGHFCSISGHGCPKISKIVILVHLEEAPTNIKSAAGKYDHNLGGVGAVTFSLRVVYRYDIETRRNFG